MKKSKYLFAAMALAFASCNSDEIIDRPVTGEGLSGRTEVKLTIPGVGNGNPISYADPLASVAENAIRNFDVYVFCIDTLLDGTEKPGGSFLLEEIFRTGKGLTLAEEADKKTTTISLIGSHKKRIYYVANGSGIASLDSVELHKTTREEFKAKITDPIPVYLACPLLMTDSTVVDDVKDAATTGIEVNLKRSVARFDILNRSDDSNFRIEWLEIENARSQGYIFPRADAYASPLMAKMERINFLTVPNANAGLASSVFYLYPTVTDGEVSMVMGGKVPTSGLNVLYPVKFVKTEGGKETKIKVSANNRYVIEVLSMGVAYIQASIKVEEWFIGDTIRSQAGVGSIVLSAKTPQTHLTSFGNNTLVLGAKKTDAETVTVDVACDTEWGYDVTSGDWMTVTPKAGDAKDVAKSFTIATKSSNPSSKTARVGVITLYNKKRPSVTQALIVKQEPNKEESIDLTSARLSGDSVRLAGLADSLVLQVGLDGTNAPTDYTYNTMGSWLTVETSAASTGPFKATTTDRFLKIKAAANTDTKSRTGSVTITAGGVEQTIRIVQSPKVLGSITLTAVGLSGGSVNFTAAGGPVKAGGEKLEVKVTAQSEWKVEQTAIGAGGATDWLTVADETGKDGNGSFTLKATENVAGSAARSVQVSVVNTSDPAIRQNFVVTQEKGAAIEITLSADVNSIAVDQIGTITGSGVVTVTTTDPAKWTATIADNEVSGGSDKWVDITSDTTVGTITVAMVDANKENGGAARTATVTITSKTDSAKEVKITIVQAGI